MHEYTLKTNETILYEGDVSIQGQKNLVHLILTNLNIVLSYSVKKGLFSKAEKEVNTYSVMDIKIYEDSPQIIQKGNNLQILFLTHELVLQFTSVIEMTKFKMAILKLLTGKSAQARGADKVKGAINMVNDTLGVDTVGTMKGVLENGVVGTLVGGIGKKNRLPVSKSKTGKVIEAIGVANEFVQKTSGVSTTEIAIENEKLSYEEQLEAVKKFKELLDAGIITEEEFVSKKKEILGM